MNSKQSSILTIMLFAAVAVFAGETSPGGGQSYPGRVKYEKVIGGLQFPEGPAWDGQKGVLYFSDCYGGAIYRVGFEKVHIFVSATSEPFNFEKTNGLAVSPDGDLYACEFSIGAILRIRPDGKCEVHCAGYQGKKFNRPNDLTFDQAGNLYFSDPHKYTKKYPNGIVYRIDKKTREATPVAEGLGFPNGLVFSPDGKVLYVAESSFQRVLKFTVKPDGSLSERSVFIELPGGDPDGMDVDRQGNLYVAHFGGGAIHVFSPEGKAVDILKTPGKKPSNIEFAGPDLRTLYVTEDETKAVYRTKVETPGLRRTFTPEQKP